jgi:hypothetical protein
MKITKVHAAWAVKLWVLVTVFLLPFLEGWEVAAWFVLGGVFALVWKVLPEVPEAPVEPLPFAHEYKDKAIPMPPKPEEPGFPPTRE